MNNYKKLIACMNAENELDSSVLEQARQYADNGADELYLYNYSRSEKEREEFLQTLRKVNKEIDIPFMVGMYMERFEDGKKAFYTGAHKIVLRRELLPNDELFPSITERFGKDNVYLELQEVLFTNHEEISYADHLVVKHVELGSHFKERLNQFEGTLLIRDSLVRNDAEELLLCSDCVEGLCTNYFVGKDIEKAKYAWKEGGVLMNTFESSLEWSALKADSNGLVPVVVQDFQTSEVLMVAYMNEQAFYDTLHTGKMHYYSRSREEQWCKGDTSGHYQYVKKLMIDCDQDTILAKVRQVGAACHTGKRSCFYTELASKEYLDTNPLTVLSRVFGVIMDRKQNPKEGSYTNYLFDKGIDKILKKCGEEATEMVIAAKNPDAEELKYEIADFLYHMMVLMAECGLDWEDVMGELSHR